MLSARRKDWVASVMGTAISQDGKAAEGQGHRRGRSGHVEFELLCEFMLEI